MAGSGDSGHVTSPRRRSRHGTARGRAGSSSREDVLCGAAEQAIVQPRLLRSAIESRSHLAERWRRLARSRVGAGRGQQTRLSCGGVQQHWAMTLWQPMPKGTIAHRLTAEEQRVRRSSRRGAVRRHSPARARLGGDRGGHHQPRRGVPEGCQACASGSQADARRRPKTGAVDFNPVPATSLPHVEIGVPYTLQAAQAIAFREELGTRLGRPEQLPGFSVAEQIALGIEIVTGPGALGAFRNQS